MPDERAQIDLFGGPAASVTPEPGTAAAAPEPVSGDGRELPDAAERARIITELESNLLVEAGAGAGKTTQMVDRMVALVRSGTGVERIAAVTFTRKAAAELRERFQTGLEKQLRSVRDRGDEQATAMVDRALREIDRAFIGTIHAFCARLLRERPLEAGVDPGFRETFAVEQERLRNEYFATHIERLAAAGDESLADLARVGLRPDQLRKLFDELIGHSDVEFPAEPVERPDPADARSTLSALLDEALALMPSEEPAQGWDNLQKTVRRLRFYRDVVGWDDDIRFLHVLAETLSAMPQARYRRWSEGAAVYDVVRDIEHRFREFTDAEGAGGRVLRQWWAHRYPKAISFAQEAARQFERERIRTGALSFQDLLLCTVRLLRGSPAARADLGERYRHILVDEFQDTDPLQAEILFLLASKPAGDDGDPPDWRRVTPRRGALFVVGDPKQSIYRFRRADITIYNQVKRRFDEFGGVVRLTANFRSGPPIENLVDAMFRERFPAQATEHQAAFAPLQVQKAAAPEQGVFSYRVEKPGSRPHHTDLAGQDAARVASWIESRVRAGERQPGDFLVLTRTRKHLAAYAREVEARNLPVQVTGGGVGIEEEMAELRLLLRALADPADPTHTVAALVGLFFGLDYEQLAEHVLDRGGHLDFVDPPASPATEVEKALATLHEFWTRARAEPADVLVSRLVHRLGLIPYAAAGELGESRAGALLFVLEAVRAAALQGDASLHGAITAIDAALDTDEGEAPLQPGRKDAVRIMNLHQAKGLEAPVVILAAPFGLWNPVRLVHITRHESGVAEGRIVVAERRWRFNDTVLARPLDWEAHEQAEREFELAEEDRLVYVAATRAEEELVIARYPDESESPWAAFYPYLHDFEALDLPISEPPPRERLEVEAVQVHDRVAEVDAHRQSMGRRSYHAAAVRKRVKGDVVHGSGAGPAVPITEGGEPDEAAEDDGMAWGKVIHAALEAAGRGSEGGALRAFCRARLLAAEEPRLDADGEPVDLERLVDMVESVTASALWQRARAAERMLVETPFSIALQIAEYVTLPAVTTEPDRPPAAAATDSGEDGLDAPLQIIDGVIDLVFREAGSWVVVDYKSDRAGAHVEPEVRRAYGRQVDLYAECWTRLTGEPVTERIILFTTDGTAVSW